MVNNIGWPPGRFTDNGSNLHWLQAEGWSDDYKAWRATCHCGYTVMRNIPDEASRTAVQAEVDDLIDRHVVDGGYPTYPQAGSSIPPSPAPRPGPGGAA